MANLGQNPKAKTIEIAERRFENLVRQFPKFFLGIPTSKLMQILKKTLIINLGSFENYPTDF